MKSTAPSALPSPSWPSASPIASSAWPSLVRVAVPAGLAWPLLALLPGLAALAHFLEQLLELLAQRLLVLAQLADTGSGRLADLAGLAGPVVRAARVDRAGPAADCAAGPVPAGRCGRASCCCLRIMLPSSSSADIMSSSMSSPPCWPGRAICRFSSICCSSSSSCLRRVLGARARQLLEPVDHALQVLRPQHAGVAVERARELLRILAHLLGQRLHEFVERRAQLVGQLLDLLVARAALQRLPQGFLRLPQGGFGIGEAAVLDGHRHAPQPRHHIAQLRRRSWRS